MAEILNRSKHSSMNREIKFRGYAPEKKWVYGCYMVDPTYIMPCAIFDSTERKFIEVDPKSVGQFTGLYDSKRTEVYEGDIITHQTVDGVMYCTHEVSFSDGCFLFGGVSAGTWRIEDNEIIKRESSSDSWTCEVIGNVFQNPELI